MLLTEPQKTVLAAIRDEAKRRVAEVPKRQAERDVAVVFGQAKPAKIEPLSEIDADLAVATLDAIKEVPPGIADIVASQKKSCALCAGRKVYLRSDQLAAIIDAAIGGGDAKVSG